MTGAEERDLGRLVPALTRLRGLLVALHREPSLASQIKGRPESLEQRLEQIVETAACEQLAEERAQLDFLQVVDGVELHSVGDEPPFPSSIRGHRWVATLPLETSADIEALLAEADTRALPDVPVFGIFRIDSGCVPIAFRVKSGRFGRLPVSRSEIEALAAALGTTVVDAPNMDCADVLIEAATEMMWFSARRAMRPADWPSPVDGDACDGAGERSRMYRLLEQSGLVEELVAEASAMFAMATKEPWSTDAWEGFQSAATRMRNLAREGDLGGWMTEGTH